MTTVDIRIYHKPAYSSYTDLSTAIIEPLDVNLKVTDGVGRFSFIIRTEGTYVLDIVDPNDIIQVTINGALMLKGYVDKCIPLTVDDEWTHQQSCMVTGRDFGQDLENKLVNKDPATSSFPFGIDPSTSGLYHADDIIELMLSEANSEVTFTSPSTAPLITYKDTGDEYLIEVIRKICEQIGYDFYIDNNKALILFEIGSVDSGITLKCVAGESDNNIVGRIETNKFDAYEVRNRVKITGGGIEDCWTDDLPDYLGWTGASGNVVTAEETIVSAGATSLKSDNGTNADTCELTLSFPKHNYTYLPFDQFIDEEVSFDIYYDVSGEITNATHLYMDLTDDEGHIIRWFGYDNGVGNGMWSTPKQVWKQCIVRVGTGLTSGIQAYGIIGAWWDNWRYLTDTGAFNWKVVKLTIGAYKNGLMEYLVVDNLKIPLSMLGIAEDKTSQTDYKLRDYPENNFNILTQREMDEYANWSLEKRKDPIASINVTALGSAGISGTTNKWIAGSTVTLNSPDDGYEDVELIMAEIHMQVLDSPIDGNDFIVNLVLVPETQVDKGTRLISDTDPEVAILRNLWANYRKLDSALGGISQTLTSIGSKSTSVDWMNIPYMEVKGNSYFDAMNQIQCEAPLFTWAELEPYLWGFDGEGNWTPSEVVLPLGNATLRFKDNTVGHEGWLDMGIIYVEMTPDDPMLWISQHLLVKKDLGVGGMLTSFQGALNLGSGLTAEGDMPQIILAHSGVDYGSMNILEINDSAGALASIKASNVYADHLNSASGASIYLFDHLRFYNGTAGLKLYDATNDSGTSGEVLTVDANGKPVWTAQAALNAYAASMNQHVRTTDSPTFSNITITNNILSGIMAPANVNSAKASFARYENFLAYVDKAYTVTVDQPVTSGSVASMFDSNPDSSARWNTTSTLPVTIEIDFATNIHYWYCMGINFIYSRIATSVKCEVYRSDAATWTTVYDTSTNTSLQITFKVSYSFVTKIKWTISGITSGQTEIAIEKIWGVNYMLQGQEWVDAGGDTMYGNLIIKSAGPSFQLRALSGDSSLQFWEIGTVKMSLAYSGGSDLLYLYDHVNSRNLATVTHNGQLTIPVTGGNAGILIGTDCHLYRSAANVLTIADTVHVSGNLYLTTDANWIALRNGDTRLYSDADGVLKVQDVNGALATLDVSNLYTDHIASASGSSIYLFDALRFFDGDAGVKLYDATNDSGSENEVLTVDSSGLPVWKTLPVWNGGTVTASIIINGNDYYYALRNGATRLYSSSDGVLQVQDKNGVLATLDTSFLCADHINSASGSSIYLFDHLRFYSGTTGVKLYDATNDSGSDGEVLTCNSSGLPVWSNASGFNGGTITNNLTVQKSGNNSEFQALRTNNASYHACFVSAPVTVNGTTPLWAAGLYLNSNNYRIWKWTGSADSALLELGTDSTISLYGATKISNTGWNCFLKFNHPTNGDAWQIGLIGGNEQTPMVTSDFYIWDAAYEKFALYIDHNQQCHFHSDVWIGSTWDCKFHNYGSGSVMQLLDDDGQLCTFECSLLKVSNLAATNSYIYALNSLIMGSSSNAQHIAPYAANVSNCGNSSFYWYAVYSNYFYGKNNGIFGCERSKSGEEWAHEFDSKYTAEEFLTHELTKTKYHIKYDVKTDDKLICTCGKSVENPCPEHMKEWADLYTVDTGRITQATGFVVLEHSAEIIRLQSRILELEERLNKVEKA